MESLEERVDLKFTDIRHRLRHQRTTALEEISTQAALAHAHAENTQLKQLLLEKAQEITVKDQQIQELLAIVRALTRQDAPETLKTPRVHENASLTTSPGTGLVCNPSSKTLSLQLDELCTAMRRPRRSQAKLRKKARPVCKCQPSTMTTRRPTKASLCTNAWKR